jgi:site-specific DNA recombinase
MLVAGEQAIAVTAPIPDDELLAAELARLDRKIDATTAERRRLADLYQSGLIDLTELQRRTSEVAARLRDLHARRDSLAAERTALAHGNLLRRRVTDFARQIREVIDQLDRPQRQHLLRLLIEDVHVTGWQVKIRLRIPLDPPDSAPVRPGPTNHAPSPATPPALSSQDRLRSVGSHSRRFLPHAPGPSTRRKHPEQEMITRGVETFNWPPAGTATWPLTTLAPEPDFPQC